MKRRPNIVWISTHDINPHLGAYAGTYPGAEAAITPNLDRLAARGARFDRAFATAPVCAPSRSSIITGMYPTTIGTMHMRSRAVPPAEVRLLPEYFRAAGYYVTNDCFTDFQVDVPPIAYDDCSPGAHWRNRPDREQPFFAEFHGMITHESQIYLDEEDFAARTRHVRDEDRHNPDTVTLPPYHPDTPVFRRSWARYLDLITEMDHWAGQIIDQLDEDGLTENTIVVFWSDHGLGMPRGKRWAYDTGLHEPLLVRWPGVIAPGTVRSDLVHVMDLAPTMLSAAGIPIPHHMQAVPLIENERWVDAPNSYVFGGRDRMDEQEDTTRTVRDQRYRYIRNFHPDRSPMQHCDYPDHYATWAEFRHLAFEEAAQLGMGELPDRLTPVQRSVVAASKPAEELYDLAADPYETDNRVGDPSRDADLHRLRAALDAWIQQTGDLGLLPEADLIQAWRPGGQRQVTAAPTIHASDAALSAFCNTPGARIAYTLDPPSSQHATEAVSLAVGVPPMDGRAWFIIPENSSLPPQRPLWVAAWRLGYEGSKEVLVQGVHTDPDFDAGCSRIHSDDATPSRHSRPASGSEEEVPPPGSRCPSVDRDLPSNPGPGSAPPFIE
jgi:uncharacterized sulfatase